MKIFELENKLLDKFPANTACEWDNTGLLVGNRDAEIACVGVALDPTVSAVRRAADAGCNLLLTHHPAFMKGMEFNQFCPADSVAFADGAVVYEAASCGVALMNFHTALDASVEGGRAIPNRLGWECSDNAVVPVECAFGGVGNPASFLSTTLGFGRLCSDVRVSGEEPTFEKLVHHVHSKFMRSATIWGDASSKVKKVVTTTGSTGPLSDSAGLLQACLALQVDTLICGEIKYHDALSVHEAGLNIIELGHDVSELPLVDVLIRASKNAGLSDGDILKINQSQNWW